LSPTTSFLYQIIPRKRGKVKLNKYYSSSPNALSTAKV
jgi:hypothetical protein